ncbi:hypothetical protein WCP94_002621 [Bilophila wadsworthia]
MPSRRPGQKKLKEGRPASLPASNGTRIFLTEKNSPGIAGGDQHRPL